MARGADAVDAPALRKWMSGDSDRRLKALRPRDAATLVLCRRDQGEPQILVGKRAGGLKFMPNLYLFPGGRVDPADARAARVTDLRPEVLARLVRGTTPARARGLPLAAIRETFEEAGVLLARRRGEHALVDAPTLRGSEARNRAALHAGERGLTEIARVEDLELAVDLLVPFAHWITPVFMPKRFDTWFFLVSCRKHRDLLWLLTRPIPIFPGTAAQPSRC